MNLPFFSIIIPTYNRAHILKRAIDSIFSQSFIEYEIVIVDDGSTDNTQEVIAAIKSDNLKYVLQPNKGVCAARNAGVAIANGSYLIQNNSTHHWFLFKSPESATGKECFQAIVLSVQ